MQQLNKRYPLGAHLIVKHLGYSHHGIYAGRGRVIHYSGLAHFIKKRPIEITSIDAFSHGKKIHVRSYDKPRYKGKIVVRRMRSR
ncbi:lecithin retinol acyltransferase family protein, partial [Acinetobacter pittii]